MRANTALVLIVVGAALSLFWLVHPWYDATNDASMYIITARSILAGDGYTYLSQPFRMRPPGFPVLIAPVLAMFGTDFTALNVTIGIFGVICVALIFLRHYQRLGVPVALAMCAAIWMNPGFRRLSGQILSDVPGAAFMLVVLVLEPWARRRPWRDCLLAALIAIATYVRSVNGLLVPAILLARLLEREAPPSTFLQSFRKAVRHGGVIAAVSFLLLLPWAMRDSQLPDTGPAEQTYHYSYGVAMWHEDSADPLSPRLSLGSLLGRAPERLSEVLPVLGGRMASKPSRLDLALGLLALGCWLVVLVRRREPDEIFVGLYLVVLALYFSFLPRLVLPLFLLVLPCVLEITLILLRRIVSSRVSGALAVVLVVMLGAIDFAPGAGWEAIAKTHRGRLDTANYVIAHYPDTTLGAPIGWHLSVYLGRPVYSLQFVNDRSGIEAVYGIIARERIGVVILDGRGRARRRLDRDLTSRFGIVHREWAADIVEIPHPESLAPPEDRG